MQSNKIVTVKQIRDTDTFQNLTPIQQKIYMNRNSRRAIEHSVNVVLNQGNNDWFRKTNSSFYHQEIVKELTSK